MRKILTICCFLLVSSAISAQPITANGTWRMDYQSDNERVLAKSVGVFMPRPDVVIDKKTKKTTAAWNIAGW